jgi:ribonuclease P protein component
VSTGPLTVVHLSETRENPANAGDSRSTTSHPRVAFAVPRAVGPAVERNRIRRRIRSIANDLAATGQMSAGAWLFIVRPGATALAFAELQTVVGDAVDTLGSRQVAS